MQKSLFYISVWLPYVLIRPVNEAISRARSIEQRLEEGQADVLFGFYEDVIARFEVVVELGRPQTYAWIDINDSAANMLFQRQSQALYNVV